jgi:O-acetylserine/cysteine efflux transporter
LGLFYAGLMALFFGLAQVYSRQLKSLDVSLTNAFTGLFRIYNFINFVTLYRGKYSIKYQID